MQDDDRLVAEQRREDLIKFLIGSTDPLRAPRLAGPMVALRSVLIDGQWHGRNELLAVMMRAGGIVLKTAENRLSALVQAGMVQRKGAWSRKEDTRMYRLVDWPATEERERWKG